MSAEAASLLEERLVPHVERASDGDRNAFAQLVEATSSTVCAIAFAIVRDAAASEDIAQDVFLSVWKGLKQLKNPRSFLPWVRQLTRNQAHSWQRRRSAGPGALQVGEEVLATVADTRPPVEASLEEREVRELVTAALEELPDEAREALVLYYREGHSTAQVAQLLGLSEAAVRKRLQRARQSIRTDVARRLQSDIEGSAPTQAFLGSIAAAAMITSAPAGAALSGKLALRGAAGTLTSGALVGTLATLAGATLGIAGVLLGLRAEFAAALDERELRALRRLRTVSILNVLLACAGFVWSMSRSHWLPPVAIYLAFLATLAALHFVWLPRIASRRLAHELCTDPEAPARHLRRRRGTRIGFTLGALCAAAGLLLGLWLSGRLP